MDEEKRLFSDVRGGDIAAFEILLTRYERLIFNHIRRMVGEQRDAEDLTQETCIKLYRHRKKIDPEKNPRAFIFTVATRTVYDFLRKKRGAKETFIIDDPESDFETIDPEDPYMSIERVENVKELAGVLAHIKPVYRSVLLLRYREDLGYQEIADVMALPLNTVKTYIYRAKKALKEELMGSRQHG